MQCLSTLVSPFQDNCPPSHLVAVMLAWNAASRLLARRPAVLFGSFRGSWTHALEWQAAERRSEKWFATRTGQVELESGERVAKRGAETEARGQGARVGWKKGGMV